MKKKTTPQKQREISQAQIGIVNELYKPVRKNFPRRKTVIKGFDDLWQIDLAEFQQYAIPYYNDTRAGHWDFKVADLPIRSSKATVGLLGFGKIPRRLAEKLNAIGYNVMAYDPFVSEEDMHAVHVQKATVEEIIAESDFISVHVPLIEATHHLLNREAFQAMKSSAYIINTARGPIIDEEAMIEALQNGEIAGAYLDVTETEPLPANSPLRTLPNVVLSPHAAWYSEDAFFEIRYKAIQNIIEKSEGKTPTYLIRS